MTTIDNKKIICRMCAVTRVIKPINELFRIVRLPNKEIRIDTTYQLKGRGAYLSKDKEVILKAQKKNILSRNLKCEIKEEIYWELLKML